MKETLNNDSIQDNNDSRMSEPTLPQTGNEDIPDIVRASYPSQIDTKKIKKKIRCLVVDAHKGTMPRLVFKPKDVSYGSKWFMVNGEKYWIVYKALKDFGKFYVYMVQHGNAVGALYYAEHEEFADANQVELMVNQHAVEVFKKNKGISQKLFMIIVITCAIAIIGLVISSQFIIGMNNQINNLKTQITNLQSANNVLQEQVNNNNNPVNNGGINDGGFQSDGGFIGDR